MKSQNGKVGKDLKAHFAPHCPRLLQGLSKLVCVTTANVPLLFLHSCLIYSKTQNLYARNNL